MNNEGVQILVFLEDTHLSAKLKYRPSRYLEDYCTGIDCTQLCKACIQTIVSWMQE